MLEFHQPHTHDYLIADLSRRHPTMPIGTDTRQSRLRTRRRQRRD